MNQLPRSVPFYVAAVMSLGIGIAAYCLWHFPLGGDLTFWLLFVALAFLGFLGDRYGLHFARGTHVHLDTIPFFASMLLFNPAAVVLIVGSARIFGAIRRNRAPIEGTFNLGQTLIYVGASAWLLNYLTDTPWQPDSWSAWLGLLATVISMYLLNTGVIAGIVGLQSHLPFVRVWVSSISSGFLEHVVMFSFGISTALIVTMHPWGLALIAVPSIIIFVTLDRTLQMEARQKQLAEQNAGLAAYLSNQAEDLRRAYRSVEETLAVKNRMLQHVTRRLSEPLAAATSQIQLLRARLRRQGVPDDLPEFGELSCHARQATRLVDEFLALEVMERRQLQVTEVTVEQLFRDCLERVAQQTVDAEVDIYGEFAADVPVLHADGARLRQMLHNLLDNAIRFSPPGGEIMLNGERTEDGMLLITLADHGTGIPAEALPHLYHWFARPAHVGAGQNHSEGLGLAIANRILELHGGSIRVESQVGIGATFYVTLPPHVPAGPAPSSLSARILPQPEVQSGND